MKITALLLLFAFPFLALAQDTQNQNYKLYNVAKQKLVSADDIVADMINADVLFFGESHTDSVGHLLEATLWQKLAAKYPGKTALSMEMFETDCQYILDEHLQGYIREKDMIKDARAWPNYKDYSQMVEFAKAGRLPVIAANAPSRYVHMVTDKGLTTLQQLGKNSLQYLPPLPIDTATGAYYEKFAAIMGGHKAMQGMNIYQSQNLWDATMAWSIASYFKKNRGSKIFQVNGSFHSEEKLGTVAQLIKYAPKICVLNIANLDDEENFDHPDWKKYQKLGDYLLVTRTKKQ
ncbi:ChaN family lipoprotein [Mucilaginibacter ximonensis]|uniref:ChaN family lipoprotein n=1 Tax=Mucilaginibacter ximonensis TaxID=538021 RepID=A0ABW5Y7I7_9SPHI